MWAGYRTVSSESTLVMFPRGFRRDGTRPTVFMLHGHNSAAAGPYNVVPTAGYGWAMAEAVLRAGYPICLPDAGGGKGWNGNTAVTKLEANRQAMISNFGAKSGPAFICGFSMGGMLAASYAAENPSNVKALVLTCAALDMVHIHDTNYNSYGTAELEAAHGGSLASYQAALPTKNPMARAAAGDLDAIPTLIYHAAPADTVCPLASYQQFAADSGAEIHQDQSQGHDPDITDPVRLIEFLEENA